MAYEPASAPVKDSVAKVNDEIAVGEDLEFQQKWWRFESSIWIFFTLIIILDLAGLFGRGPIAKAERHSPEMDLKYERIERSDSSSILTVKFSQSAIKDGKVRLFVSESLVQELGNQRIIPAPLDTTVGSAGLTYTFLASEPPASVDFDLQPAKPGLYHFTIGVPGGQPVQAKVFVVP